MVCTKTQMTLISGNINVMAAVSEDLQKPTEDTFQEKRYTCRTAALCLGLLTLLLLAGIARLGIQDTRDQIQSSCNTIEEVKKLEDEIDNLTKRISQSEEESVHLQAVNTNITNQRDELQNMLNESDCCLQNWKMFHNHCYFVSTSTKSWSESKKDCENRRAYLVTITSDAEQDYIKGLKERVWIGLKRDGNGNNWKWVDDSPLTRGYWAHKQPDNFENVEDCVETYPESSFMWNDLPCGYSSKWICEMEK